MRSIRPILNGEKRFQFVPPKQFGGGAGELIYSVLQKSKCLMCAKSQTLLPGPPKCQILSNSHWKTEIMDRLPLQEPSETVRTGLETFWSGRGQKHCKTETVVRLRDSKIVRFICAIGMGSGDVSKDRHVAKTLS